MFLPLFSTAIIEYSLRLLGSGYEYVNRGDHAVFEENEKLDRDDTMETFLATSPGVSQIKEYLAQNGMVTMHQDGLLKVLEKIRTVDPLPSMPWEALISILNYSFITMGPIINFLFL